jgi:hypothetical protein
MRIRVLNCHVWYLLVVATTFVAGCGTSEPVSTNDETITLTEQKDSAENKQRQNAMTIGHGATGHQKGSSEMAAEEPVVTFDVNTFWIKGSGSKTPVTEELIAGVESRFGVQLPPILKKLYRVQNGGDTEYQRSFEYWPIQNEGFERFRTICDLAIEMGIIEAGDIPDVVLEEGLDKMLIIGGYNWGHDYIALDYHALNSNGEPMMIRFDNELGEVIPKDVTLLEYFKHVSLVTSASAVRCPSNVPLIADFRGSEEFPKNATKLFESDNEVLLLQVRDDGDDITLSHIPKPIIVGGIKQVRNWFEIHLSRPNEENGKFRRPVQLTQEMSRKTSHGWKNSTSAINYVTLDHPDEAELERVHERLCEMNAAQWEASVDDKRKTEVKESR